MTRTLDVPLTGPPVTRTPTLAHEFALAGLRVMALPPGEVEIGQVMAHHMLDVNLNPVRHETAVNSDRLVAASIPADSLSWATPSTDFRLRCRNVDWGLLLELAPDRAERLVAEAAEAGGLPAEFATYRPAPRAALLSQQLMDHLRFGVPDRLFVEG